MLHVHVFLAAPLSACDMSQAGADEHQRGVAVGEGSDYAGPSSDLAVQAFNDVVCADTTPMFGGESTVGQRFHDAVLYLLPSLSVSSPGVRQ